MPNQTVSFKRSTVIISFLLLTLAFVTMGTILGIQVGKNQEATKINQNNILLIQQSRVEACKKTYNIFRDLINFSAEQLKKTQHGNLTDKQKAQLDIYYDQLDPNKCVKTIVTSKPTKPT